MDKRIYALPHVYFIRDFKNGVRIVRHVYVKGQRTRRGQRRMKALVQSGRWSLSPANAWADWLPMPGRNEVKFIYE